MRAANLTAALFVDAGWVLATAAVGVLGTPQRDQLACQHAGFLAALSDVIREHSAGMRHLRTYWYDAAVESKPTVEHNRIALLPYVTVRLGRLTQDQEQKGVDMIIYRDLVNLARERAITRAYLLAGDEDLREGVSDAKQAGVQVVLLGMPVADGHNQSAHLVREADELHVLGEGVWRGHFRRRDPADEDVDGLVAEARKLGEAFARLWVNRTPPAAIEEVVNGLPTLPRDLDIELLTYAERQIGALRRRPDVKNELRGGFSIATRTLVAEARKRSRTNLGSPTP